MPRVSKHKKSTRGGEYRCSSCSEPIKVGEEYYQWSHYRSRPTRQHAKHGSPKQSQLTQSKLSGVYAAIEGAESTISSVDSIDDIKDALTTCAEAVREVAQEYEDNIGNMPDSLQYSPTADDMREKSENLNTFADELDNAANDINECDEDEPQREDYPEGDEGEENYNEAVDAYTIELEQAVEDARTAAEEALGNLNV